MKGERYVVALLSEDYGERRYAVEDLSLQRDNYVRTWRSRGVGKVSVQGVKRPKTGLIWRGTEAEAEELCRALNKTAALGQMSVATDPPTRENSRYYAAQSQRNSRGSQTAGKTSSKQSTSSSPVRIQQMSMFRRCETCKKMVREPHGEH